MAEYARWTRIRDRLCGLDDKDNVPLEELSGAESCLADYLKQKAAELAAAKGDPRRVFGRELLLPTPDADAVDLCVGKIHSSNTCENFLRISRVSQLDTEVSAQEAIVTAEIEMKVLTPFAVCSPIASNCTGSCWDLQSGQPKPIGNRSGKTCRSPTGSGSRNRLRSRSRRAATGNAARTRCGRSNSATCRTRRSETHQDSICVDALQLLRRVWHANARLSFLFGGKKTRRIFSFAFRIAL